MNRKTERAALAFLFLEEYHVRQYQKQYWNDSEVCQYQVVNNLPTVEKALKTVFRIVFNIFKCIEIGLCFSGYIC